MSGIAILRRLLMKQAMKKSVGSSGIMTLNKGLVKDVDNTVKKWIDSGKRQGVDIDKMSEQHLKYIVELNKPKPIRAVHADSSEGQVITRDLFNMLDRQSGKNVIKTDFGGGITDDVSEIIIKIKTMEPMDAMKEANRVLKGEGRYKSLSKTDRKKIVDDESVTDHIFERNYVDPEDFAQGGRASTGLNYLLGEDDQNMRVPYSKGSRKKSWTDRIAGWTGGKNVMAGEIGIETWDLLNNLLQSGGLYAEGGRTGFGIGGLTRRAFLKLMGGAAATGAAAKTGLFGLLKGGGKKQVVKELTSVPIGNPPGMPEWFKPLVNRIIKEGNKIDSGAERVIAHKAKLPNSKTDVYLEQDLVSGDINVQIGSGKHGWGAGHHGQPVNLQYTAPQHYPTHTEVAKIEAYRKPAGPDDLGHFKGTQDLSNKKTKPEFWVEEAEFTGGHPENVKFEESLLKNSVSMDLISVK